MEEPKLYVSCKIVKAAPMMQNVFIHDVLNKKLAEGQKDRPGYYVEYPDGYESWSPKEPFEESHRLITPKEMGLIIE